MHVLLFRRDSEFLNEIFHKPKIDLDFYQLKISEAYYYMDHFLKETKFIAADKVILIF